MLSGGEGDQHQLFKRTNQLCRRGPAPWLLKKAPAGSHRQERSHVHGPCHVCAGRGYACSCMHVLLELSAQPQDRAMRICSESGTETRVQAQGSATHTCVESDTEEGVGL